MALTALQLLTEIAAAEAKTWDATIAGGTSDLTEMVKFQIVTKANEALRWWWKEHDRMFAWPETVDSDATTAVTSGLIANADLGEASWCSLWSADPRPYDNSAYPIRAERSEDGVHPLDSATNVFAFFRTACPQITYASGGSYATPSDIPNVCLQPVSIYANGCRLRSQGQFKEGNEQIERAFALFHDRRHALLNSGLIWQTNPFAMS